MSIDMIKDMTKQSKIEYKLDEESEAIKMLKKKSLEMMDNPVRAAYENNIKQPAGKIFQVPCSMLLNLRHN